MGHNAIKCSKPFCSDCWAIIKGNIQGIMKVADELRSKPHPIKHPSKTNDGGSDGASE